MVIESIGGLRVLDKISIITASFRSEGTIVDTLKTINSQTYGNIEHIIVDGGSDDGTLEIVNDIGQRITKIVSEKDNGIYDAYNKGLELADGEVVGFLNSDDYYYSDEIIQKVMDVFQDEAIEAVYGDLVYVARDDTSKVVRHWRSKEYRPGMFKDSFVPAHPTLFLRKSVYQRLGNFNLDYKLAADYEFMLRVFHSAGVKSSYLPTIMVNMRTGGATGESLSSVKAQNKEILGALKQHGVDISSLNFMARKAYDRVGQKLRAAYSLEKQPGFRK